MFDKNIIMYSTTVVLQIVSLVFLFRFKSLDYIIYIYSFVLYAFSPVLLLVAENMDWTPFNLFKQGCLFLSYCFVLSGLFLVILTNEKNRKLFFKKETIASKYYKKSILTLYAITLPLTWCLMVDHRFATTFLPYMKTLAVSFFPVYHWVLDILYILIILGVGITMTITSIVLFVQSYKNYKIAAKKRKTDV